jgi:hypothetical protein
VSDFDKMNAEDKALWIEALRSDKFKQGRFELRTDDGCNCCLGVLAEIKGIQYRVESNDHCDYTEYNFDGVEMDAAVPEGFCGLSEPTITKLIHLNDDDQLTFPEIAKFIEENL